MTQVRPGLEAQMTEQVSIWRWAVTDDLDGLFARLVAASEDKFVQIALEIEGGAPGAPSMDQIEAETEGVCAVC